jgi:hypothetical protein
MFDEFGIGAIWGHMGECEIHNIVYVEVDPTNLEGCPICAKEESQKDHSNMG